MRPALILAGAFVVIAVIALIGVAMVQRRKPPPPPPAARKPWWTDPALVVAALDAGRGLGRRRGVAVTMLIAAFAIGAVLPWMPRRPQQDRDRRAGDLGSRGVRGPKFQNAAKREL